MKSLTLLLQTIVNEIGDWCHTSTTRDLKTITSRIESEGISFLTISLSNFGKDLEKGLDQGFVDRNLFRGFAFQAGLPRLFGGFLDLIFDRTTGVLLEEPSIDAIRGLRQVSLMFSKVALECTQVRTDAAIEKYLQCEMDLRENDATLDDSFLEEFRRVSTLLFGDVFSYVDREVYMGHILPKHGPGSTADKLFGNSKFNQKEWTERLDEVFPHGEYLTYNWMSYLNDLSDVVIREPGSERPVRVITVPKTLKTPRIIAIEPTAMQYMQQGILEKIVEGIEASDFAKNLIRFMYQEPNQQLAHDGSLYGKLATLDLSEASDRVSNQHVRTMLSRFPHFAEAVDATRSRKADVNGKIIRLAKFASMGSALCFPMEALVFCTIVFMGIQDELNTPLNKKIVKSLLGKVRVYGDDIIVPVEYVESVVGKLETFGLKVNHNKSFWTGKFRESCGKDYYAGHDVTTVKVRQILPTSRKQSTEIISTVSLRNQLYKAGYWQTVRFLDNWIERLIPFPRVAETSPALGKFSFLGYDQEKMDPHLHKPLVKAMVIVTELPNSKLDGYGALMKHFLKRGELPFADRRHLEIAGRPTSLDIKRRWTSAY